MARAAKEATVAELTDRFASSDGAVLTEYRGLTVSQVGELRQSLGEHATFSVVKNTLTKIAARDAGVDENFSQLLAGPSAIAFVRGDIVKAAKGLRDFAKVNPFLVIKGGILDGRIVSPAEISKLADLESREMLLAKLAGAMKASLSGAAATFAALPVQMARLAAALADKRSAEGPAEPGAAAETAGSADGSAPAGSAQQVPAETAQDAEAGADADAPAQDAAPSADATPAAEADTGGTAASTGNS